MIARLRNVLRALFRRDAVLDDIDEELRTHLAMMTEDNLRRGMTPAAARAAAERAFGNLGVVRDDAYDVRGGGMLETLVQDVRFGARMLRKHPGVTLAAMLTMAVGIGATTAVFSVVNPLLLRPLPFAEPSRLVDVREQCLPKFDDFSVSPGDFLTWRDHSQTLSGMAAYKNGSLTLTGAGDPERLHVRRISTGYFDVFGVQPSAGRGFRADEEGPDEADVVIISNGLWQRDLGGDPRILDRSLTLDGKPYQVVGVMPRDVHIAMGDVDVWTPVGFTAADREHYGQHSYNVVARLRPNATIAAAHAELDDLEVALDHDHPQTNAGWRVKMQPLNDAVVGSVRPTLSVLAVAVAFLLLIACANVASLLLGRGAAREREIAVRVALGASRGRIIRQLATESALLSLMGGAVGLALGAWSVDLLLSLQPGGLAGLKSVTLDVPLVVFACIASLVVGVVVGIIPALQAFKVDVNAALKEGGRSGSDGAGRARLRRALVAFEVAACVLLLVGAGLLVRSLDRLLAVDPGFDPEHVTTATMGLPRQGYPDDAAQRAYTDHALRELATVPGVSVAAAAQTVPFTTDWVFGFNTTDEPANASVQQPSANFYAVSPDYFTAMGIRLVNGRAFTASDNADAPPVMIIDEKLAKQFYPDGDALGKFIVFDPPRRHQIVGIVADVRQYALSQPASLEMYTPLAQDPFAQVMFVVRGNPAPADLRARLRGVDANLPVGAVVPLARLVSDSVARQRFAVILLSIFAAIAILLATVGIYGVISDAVTQRTREMGIRLALGARSSDCIRLVMGQGLLPVVIGLAVGLAAALVATRVMTSLLYDVSATDPLTLALATGLIAVVALVASYLPARRATRVDPAIALRAD